MMDLDAWLAKTKLVETLGVTLGRFGAIRFAGTAAILDYTVAGTAISETLRARAAAGH